MDDQPKRIQRQRTRGWRMPPNTVYVGRPTKWGNPYEVVDILDAFSGDVAAARLDCVSSYRWALTHGGDGSHLLQMLPELRGKDLACWCPLGQPCHADVLLELANQ
jgi:hypothetical protein